MGDSRRPRLHSKALVPMFSVAAAGVRQLLELGPSLSSIRIWSYIHRPTPATANACYGLLPPLTSARLGSLVNAALQGSLAYTAASTPKHTRRLSSPCDRATKDARTKIRIPRCQLTLPTRHTFLPPMFYPELWPSASVERAGQPLALPFKLITDETQEWWPRMSKHVTLHR